MKDFIKARPEGNPDFYAIAICYSHTGSNKDKVYGWYTGMSDFSRLPRRAKISRNETAKKIKLYINSQVAHTKIIRDIFTDNHVISAVVVPLDPTRKPIVSSFNLNFGGKNAN